MMVTLSTNNIQKDYLVHRLVAMAYLPNPNNLPQINHKDEIKDNNNVNNLEWCDCQYNIEYSRAIPVICIETGEIFKSAAMCGRIKGVPATTITRAVKHGYKVKGEHYAYYR